MMAKFLNLTSATAQENQRKGDEAEKVKQQWDSIFFFIHLKFSQETNKDYLYNQFVILLI